MATDASQLPKLYENASTEKQELWLEQTMNDLSQPRTRETFQKSLKKSLQMKFKLSQFPKLQMKRRI